MNERQSVLFHFLYQKYFLMMKWIKCFFLFSCDELHWYWGLILSWLMYERSLCEHNVLIFCWLNILYHLDCLGTIPGTKTLYVFVLLLLAMLVMLFVVSCGLLLLFKLFVPTCIMMQYEFCLKVAECIVHVSSNWFTKMFYKHFFSIIWQFLSIDIFNYSVIYRLEAC